MRARHTRDGWATPCSPSPPRCVLLHLSPVAACSIDQGRAISRQVKSKAIQYRRHGVQELAETAVVHASQ